MRASSGEKGAKNLFADPKRNSDTAHGTAIGLPISWGGARGVNGAAVLWQSHGVSGIDMMFKSSKHLCKTVSDWTVNPGNHGE